MSNQQNGAGQDMDKSSLRLRIEKALYNDEFQEELSRYGFTSTAEVAAFPRFNALLAATKAKTGDTPLPTYKFYREAQKRAMRVETVMRDAIVTHDPLSQALRHVRTPALPQGVATELENDPIRYAKPDSIQSSQSPAAYLKHIYDLAKQITPADPLFGLDTRRPDLAKLELSEDNLHQEITTLELVNEVLAAQIKAAGNNDLAFLKTQLHPLALPFDKDLATIRTGLAQMNGMSLNEISRRLDQWVISDNNFTLVPNYIDALNLSQPDVEVLKKTVDTSSWTSPQMFADIYGDATLTPETICIVDNFITTTDISFDEFIQLYRDYGVVDERGYSQEANKYGARFFTDYPLCLACTNGKLEMKSPNSDGSCSRSLAAYTYAGMNHLVRLYKRTGLAFHQLDWLLSAVPGAKGSKCVTDVGFDVIAHYFYWLEQYNLSVDEFVGLLSEVNSYRRLGEQETSLLGQMFGADAAYVNEQILDGTTTLSQVETATNKGITLGDILRRGLKLSRAEWNAIVIEVGGDTKLNQTTFSQLYRLAKLFPLLGWNVLTGIDLVKKIDAMENSALLTTLTAEATSENIKSLLSVMDRLVWLSQWMKISGFSTSQLLIILTPPDKVVLQHTQKMANWLHELHQAIQIHRVTDSFFAPYTDWTELINNEIKLIEISVDQWFQQLIEKGILDDYGLVKDVDKDDIATAVDQILTSASAPQNPELRSQLIDSLVQIQASQKQVLAEQVVQLTKNGNTEVVPPLLAWIGTNAYSVLNTFLLWDYRSDSIGSVLGVSDASAQLIYNLIRHLTVISTLLLDPASVAMVTQHPDWLTDTMNIPLSLEQVYYLHCWKQLQNAEVSADLWLSYLKKVFKEKLANSTENDQILALLLDWNPEDIAIFRGDAAVKTVQQIDALARQIQLCRDLCLSATELLSLTNLEKAATGAGAVLAGLSRYQDGQLATVAQNALNEKLRDALVAGYISKVVAPNDILKAEITDTESLYEYLLLDVNVSSAVPTSRLVEATSSVQVYINRMLEGVEIAEFNSENNPKAALEEEWETAQQYRVWEANEKLKLYPSNYIEPELRLKKTEVFNQFEQSLSKGSLNPDMVETAIYSYIKELQHLTELEPTGFFHIRTPAYIDYYFTAKASWSHLTYYYRHMRLNIDALKQENRQSCDWGEWKRIDLPTSNQTIYGVYPAYAWNRLFLLWIELEEKRSEDGTTTTYFLRPKYLRQGVDGSFGEPWNPKLGEGVDEKLSFDNPPSTPTIYQAHFDSNDQKIRQFFVIDKEASENYLSFEITQKTAEITKNDSSIYAHDIDISGYVSSQGCFVEDRQPSFVFDPPNLDFIYDKKGNEIDSSMNGSRPEVANDRFSLNRGEKICLRLEWSVDQTKFTISLPEIIFIGTVSGNYQPINAKCDLKVDVVDDQNNSIGGDSRFGEFSSTEGSYCNITFDPQTIDCQRPNQNTFIVKVSFSFEVHTYPRGTQSDQEDSDKVINIFDESVSTDFLCYEETGDRKEEGYLVVNDATIDGSNHVIHLVSQAMRQVPELLPMPDDITTLFSLQNQKYPEPGVNTFLTALKTATPPIDPISEPQPKNTFDFDGPFGIYGWELFFHIPALISSKYADMGNYDEAERWMKCIYNPSYDPSNQNSPWGVLPLTGSITDGSRSITDPDDVALKNPIHYQHAIIRQHLEHSLAEGDDYYRQQTQETLQQAKLRYVVAKNLFRKELADELDVLTSSDWSNPTLGNVVPESDFRPPFNQEIQSLYQTFEKRLYNLRHWLTIDGEPLNIPLLAAPIDPRQLQLAAQSGVAATDLATLTHTVLPYTFAEILGKAQYYTKELMRIGSRLQHALEKRDERALEELGDSLTYSFDLAIEMQNKQIDIEKKAKETLEAAKATLDKNLKWQKGFANELHNGYEIASFTTLSVREIHIGAQMAATLASGGLRLIPNIYGFAMGGTDPEAITDASADVSEAMADILEKSADALMQAGSNLRRQEEAKRDYEVIEMSLKESDLAIAEADLKIQMEEKNLEIIELEKFNEDQMIAFRASRFTNEQFYNWYIGRISNLYSLAYDATVSFALMAERAFQNETGETIIFIRPQWDRRYKGLLAGEALWVDLERMDLEYFNLKQPEQTVTKSISLGQLDESVLASLKLRGEAVFHLNESLFEADYPEHYGRQIQSIRVSFPALESQGIAPRGQLTQISSRKYHSRQRDVNRSVVNLFAHQTMILDSCQTDSRQLSVPKGRLLPFQGTGVDSTWHLSFPAAVKAIREKQMTFPQKAVLDELKDVMLEITYSVNL
ncbi:MAG: neuraminidase-like domain-containing protein [Potamolinea sp.]